MKRSTSGAVIGVLLALALAPPIVGCGSRRDSASNPPHILVGKALPPADGTRITLTITPADDANDGLPFHMMARAVREQSYLVEPYQSVAAQVMTPDETVVRSWVMHPGRPQVINIEVPEDGRLALYALFSSASGTWKTLLPPNPPGHVRVGVTGMRLESSASR